MGYEMNWRKAFMRESALVSPGHRYKYVEFKCMLACLGVERTTEWLDSTAGSVWTLRSVSFGSSFTWDNIVSAVVFSRPACSQNGNGGVRVSLRQVEERPDGDQLQ